MKDSDNGLEIEYLEEAIDDLNNITDYYWSIFSAESAKKIYEQIRNSILRLKQFPESGRPSKNRTLSSLGYKECYSQRFVVIYRVHYAEGKIYIYHIADMQRDYPNLYQDGGRY